MGLDILGLSRLAMVRAVAGGGDFEPAEGGVELWGWHSLHDVRDACEYSGDLPTGIYRQTTATERHIFRVTYGGFTGWRGQLSRFALGSDWTAVSREPGRFSGRPFLPLLTFPGQGYFGPRAASELATDLRRLQARAQEFALSEENQDGFMYVYANLAVAAELAARQGMLYFF
jgi:hypothetical protein